MNDKTEWVLVPREPTEAMWNAGKHFWYGNVNRAIQTYAAMLAAAPKPEAQAAGLPWLLRERAQVAGVVTGELLNRAADAIEALSTTASHDAQQPDYSDSPTAREAAARELLAAGWKWEHNKWQQPAVVGDGVQLMNDALAEAFKDDPAAAVRAHAAMLPLVSKLVALTPAATPGEQPVTPCPHPSEDECDCPTPGMDDEQALDGLALRMANTYPMAAIIRALDKHAPGIRHAFAPPKAVKEGNGNG